MRIPKTIVALVIGFGLGVVLAVNGLAVITTDIADADAAERADAAEALYRVAVRHLGHEQLEAEWAHELNEFPNENANRAASAETRQDLGAGGTAGDARYASSGPRQTTAKPATSSRVTGVVGR
jgi:hypothetical protein